MLKDGSLDIHRDKDLQVVNVSLHIWVVPEKNVLFPQVFKYYASPPTPPRRQWYANGRLQEASQQQTTAPLYTISLSGRDV